MDENKSTEKLKQFTSSLNKVLECAICLETVRVPFKQCATGHVLCCDCVKSLRTCPTCQRPFTAENPVSMRNLLETLPRLCRHSGSGCEKILEPGDGHETFCGFRPVRCPQPTCAVTKPLCQLLQHYRQDHPSRCVVRKREQDMEIKTFKFDGTFSNTPVCLFDNLFWVIITKDIKERQLTFSFEATPNGRLKDDFYVRVELKQDEYVYSYTLKASVVSDGDNKDARDSGGEEDKYIMTVPHSALKHFIDEEGSLTFKLSFFKVKE